MSNTTRNSLRLALGLAISALFLWLALRGLRWDELGERWSRIDVPLFVAACLIHPLRFVFIALRWSLLLKPIKPVPPTRSFPIVALSFAANNVLPFRAGEAVRVIAICRQERISASPAIATVAVDRVIDGATMLLFFILAATAAPMTAVLRHAALSLALVSGVAVVAVYALVLGRGRFAPLTSRLLAILPVRYRQRAGQVLGSFVVGLSGLASLFAALQILLYSILAWIAEVSVYFLVARSLGLGLSFPAAMFVMVAANMAVVIPSSPGYVGVFEWATISAASVFAIVGPTAATFALSVHFALYVPITTIGLVCWLATGFRRAREASEGEAHAEDETGR